VVALLNHAEQQHLGSVTLGMRLSETLPGGNAASG
jgi:hypothetical protein